MNRIARMTDLQSWRVSELAEYWERKRGNRLMPSRADIDPAEIKRLLVSQVTGTVRWRESVLAMQAAGVTRMVELGGRVLGPMVKRIAPDIQNFAVTRPEDIDAVLKAL